MLKNIFYVVLLSSPIAFAANAPINYMGWGGVANKAIEAITMVPYQEKTSQRFRMHSNAGDALKIIRAGSLQKKVDFDIVGTYESTIQTLIDENLLEPIDLATFPMGHNGSSPELPAYEDFLRVLKGFDGKIYGVSNISFSTAIAYHKKRVGAQPTKAEDFFDLKRFPGKRSVYAANPVGLLELALLADHIAKDKVYQVLSTEEGLAQAFKKLETLKGHLLFWTSGMQPIQQLVTGEAVFSTAWNSRVYQAVTNENEPLDILWDGSTYQASFLAIPKYSQNKSATMDYIRFATNTMQLANFTTIIAWAPMRKTSQQFIEPKVKKFLPTTHLDQVIAIQSEFYSQNQEKIQRLWEQFKALA